MVLFDGVVTDEEIMMLLLEHFTKPSIPTHLQYPQFDMSIYTEEQFISWFRFRKGDIERL